MRALLICLVLIHALCHLPGFLVAWRWADLPLGPVSLGDTSFRIAGLVSLLLTLGFVGLAAGVWLRSAWWLWLSLPLCLLSALLCVALWPAARWGLAANALVLVFVALAVRFPGDALATSHPELERLWAAPAPSRPLFETTNAGPYLHHAIARGTPLASRVRLRMHGEIKLGRWYPFHGEQVIDAQHGMVWAATVSMFGLPVRGADQVIDGHGRMSWRLLDWLPVATAEGPDVTRSGLGRWLGETASWLPSALYLRPDSVEWLPPPASGEIRFRLQARGETTELTNRVDPSGKLLSVSFPRWGNPAGGPSAYHTFGVVVEEERTFGGYTVPSRIRAGWYFGTDDFARQGEFFRATIDDVRFR